MFYIVTAHLTALRAFRNKLVDEFIKHNFG